MLRGSPAAGKHQSRVSKRALGFGVCRTAASASSDPVLLSSPSAARLKTLQGPQLLARRRRRLLLDDLGRIPVAAIDQRPHLGRLRGSGVGGGGVAAAAPSLQETRMQRRRGSRPCQPPAHQHATSSAGRSRRAGSRHPPATASLSPAPPAATPPPFKGGAPPLSPPFLLCSVQRNGSPPAVGDSIRVA